MSVDRGAINPERAANPGAVFLDRIIGPGLRELPTVQLSSERGQFLGQSRRIFNLSNELITYAQAVGLQDREALSHVATTVLAVTRRMTTFAATHNLGETISDNNYVASESSILLRVAGLYGMLGEFDQARELLDQIIGRQVKTSALVEGVNTIAASAASAGKYSEAFGFVRFLGNSPEAITAWAHVAESAHNAGQDAVVQEQFPQTEVLQMASEIPSNIGKDAKTLDQIFRPHDMRKLTALLTLAEFAQRTNNQRMMINLAENMIPFAKVLIKTGEVERVIAPVAAIANALEKAGLHGAVMGLLQDMQKFIVDRTEELHRPIARASLGILLTPIIAASGQDVRAYLTPYAAQVRRAVTNAMQLGESPNYPVQVDMSLHAIEVDRSSRAGGRMHAEDYQREVGGLVADLVRMYVGQGMVDEAASFMRNAGRFDPDTYRGAVSVAHAADWVIEALVDQHRFQEARDVMKILFTGNKALLHSQYRVAMSIVDTGEALYRIEHGQAAEVFYEIAHPVHEELFRRVHRNRRELLYDVQDEIKKRAYRLLMLQQARLGNFKLFSMRTAAVLPQFQKDPRMPWNQVYSVQVNDYDLPKNYKRALQLDALRAYYGNESTTQYVASAPFTPETQDFFPQFSMVSFGA